MLSGNAAADILALELQIWQASGELRQIGSTVQTHSADLHSRGFTDDWYMPYDPDGTRIWSCLTALIPYCKCQSPEDIGAHGARLLTQLSAFIERVDTSNWPFRLEAASWASAKGDAPIRKGAAVLRVVPSSSPCL